MSTTSDDERTALMAATQPVKKSWMDYIRENKMLIIIILVIIAVGVWWWWSNRKGESSTGTEAPAESSSA